MKINSLSIQNGTQISLIDAGCRATEVEIQSAETEFPLPGVLQITMRFGVYSSVSAIDTIFLLSKYFNQIILNSK